MLCLLCRHPAHLLKVRLLVGSNQMPQRDAVALEVHVYGEAAHEGMRDVSKALQLQGILPWVTLCVHKM